MPPLPEIHPAVARWFARTCASPTDAQAAAWPRIQAARYTLVAAPTGSGKTLTLRHEQSRGQPHRLTRIGRSATQKA